MTFSNKSKTLLVKMSKKELTDLETTVGGAPSGRKIYAPEAYEADYVKY